MNQSSLEKFIKNIRENWGPLDTELSEKFRSYLSDLAKTSPSENWLQVLLQSESESTELYRDPEHGFILLAHTEKEGRYRQPHDHGNGWVVYAVQSGEMEMRTYGKMGGEADLRIVRRESYRVQAGQSRLYLPGDIHDTQCISPSVLMFRFTSCDLKKESAFGRLHRYE